VISDISGIKHIGIGKDYTTLTSAAADLNLKYMAGPVTFILDDSNYPTETFPVKFNARPGNSAINTLTIKPDVNANVTISGSSAGSGILIFNGLDYVTLDGSNNGTDTKNLILENTSYSGNAHVVSLSNNNGTDPSTYVTMKNTTMRGAKSWNPYIDTYVIVFNYLGGASGGGYNNCLISNNFIQRAKIGISLLGSLGNVNRNNTISGNIIGSPDTNFHIQRYGIGLSSCDNTLIGDNEIMGTSVPTIFDGLYGIIYYDYTSNTKIHRNKIHDWNTYSLGSFGIRCSSFLDNTPTEIFDNLIYNISTPGMNQGPANNNAYGIFVRQGGNIKIWNNTINLDGPYLAGSDSYAPSSACLGFYDQSTNNFDIRGNIFRNAMTNPNNPPPGSGAEGRAYGIMFTGPVSKFSYLDNNNYYIDGYRGTIALHWQPGVGPITTLDTLESWQAYTGQEANSTDLNPQFVSEVPPQNYHQL
jgi:parallel beta-helix repeat protein